MGGIQFNKKLTAGEPSAENEPSAHLLAKQGDLEVMLYRITGESVVWLYPATDPNAIEYFFIHEGGVDLARQAGQGLLLVLHRDDDGDQDRIRHRGTLGMRAGRASGAR